MADLAISTPPATEPASPTTVVTETPNGITARAAERPEYIPEKFWKGNVEEATKAMAESYSELEKKQSAKPEVTPATPAAEPSTPELTPEQKAAASAIESALTTTAGGATELKTTLDWARANATAEQKAAFDAALDAGNPALVNMVFGQIKQSYTEAMGTQGTRVSGEGSPTVVGAAPFSSQMEIAAFVNTPKYKSGDPATHAEYERRLRVTKF